MLPVGRRWYAHGIGFAIILIDGSWLHVYMAGLGKQLYDVLFVVLLELYSRLVPA